MNLNNYLIPLTPRVIVRHERQGGVWHPPRDPQKTPGTAEAPKCSQTPTFAIILVPLCGHRIFQENPLPGEHFKGVPDGKSEKVPKPRNSIRFLKDLPPAKGGVHVVLGKLVLANFVSFLPILINFG